jgi:hypothetical protein
LLTSSVLLNCGLFGFKTPTFGSITIDALIPFESSHMNFSECKVRKDGAAVHFHGRNGNSGNCSFYSVSGCIGHSLIFCQSSFQSFSFTNFLKNSVKSGLFVVEEIGMIVKDSIFYKNHRKFDFVYLGSLCIWPYCVANCVFSNEILDNSCRCLSETQNREMSTTSFWSIISPGYWTIGSTICFPMTVPLWSIGLPTPSVRNFNSATIQTQRRSLPILGTSLTDDNELSENSESPSLSITFSLSIVFEITGREDKESDLWIEFSATLIRGRSLIDEPLGVVGDEQSVDWNGWIIMGAIIGVIGLGIVMSLIILKTKRLKGANICQREGVPSDEDICNPGLHKEVVLIDFLTGKTVSVLDICEDLEELESSI